MVEGKSPRSSPGKEPWGLRWRSSLGFVTFGAHFPCTQSRDRILNLNVYRAVVMLGAFLRRDTHELEAHPVSQTGILTDLLVYSLIIPVVPYQLEALGYDGIGAKISWLLVAFVRLSVSMNCKPLIYPSFVSASPEHWRCQHRQSLTTPRSIITASFPYSPVSSPSSGRKSCSWRLPPIGL